MSPPPFYRASPTLPIAFHKPAAIPKAPIVNPYEKFTQPQFDAWIGDITGALRGALGYRAEAPSKPKARVQWHIAASQSSEAPDATDEDADAELDDSFAEVKARRAVTENAKGKGRDPREGPGLGKGERGAPIEIDLDSEGEEEEEEEEWDEDEEGMQTSDEEEEEENALRNGESSAHAHARYRRYADRREDEAEEEYEDEEGDANDPIEVISDDEEDGERDINGIPLQNGQGSGEEYSDEEDANPTSLLVAAHKPTRVAERDYSDDGEETGSGSEDEPVAGSSPPRQAAHPHFHPDDSRHALKDGMFGDYDDELDDAVDLSPPRRERAEPEIIEVGSDDEEEDLEDQEEDVQEEDEFMPGDGQDEDDLHIQPQLHIQRDEQDSHDNDDVLPGSSPILSSPVEPEHSFPPEVFDEDAQYQSKPFDWDHPPAFARGVTASGPGHLATPVEDDGIVGSDEYQLETFGTSDLLPTFKSLSQVQTDSEPERLQFDEESKGGVTEPFSHDLAQEYFVTEAEEDERDTDDLGHLDAYTISRSISVDPHHFVVEESLTDHEPDDRGMSLDVATVDGELEDPDAEAPASGDIEETQIRETDSSEDVRRYKPEVRPSFLSHQDSEDARELVATLDSALSGELDTVTQLIESQVPGERNGDASSFLPDDIPMPVLADPTVHDPSALQPPTTPPRVPMILSLPGSPLLLSPVATPAGQPTPVSLPVPASLLKAMHIRSSLFTPNVTAPTTPHPVDHSTPGDSRAVSQTGYFDLTNVKDTIKESQSIPDFSTPVTPLNGHDTEDPTKFSEAVNDEAMVDVFPDVAAEIEQTDTVGAMQEDASHGEEDVVPEPELQQLTPIEELSSDVVSSEEIAREVETTLPHAEQDAVPEAELQQLTHIEEIPADMASSEETDHERIETPALEAALPDEEQYDVPEAELQQLTHVATDMASSEDINYDHTEAVTTEAYLPREEELAVAHGGGPTATPEVNEVTSPSYSEEMDNQVVAAEPEASSTAPNEEQHLEASFPPILELGPPSDDLSAHVEHPELLEHEEITQVSLLSTADKDFEDKAEGDDATSPVPSQDRGAGEVDEIQLQYPSESDLKVPTDVEVERAESVDAADEADDISEESETDADGDDDPEYEDSSSASSVAGELDVDRDDHTIDASPEVVTGEDAGSPVPQIEDAEVPQEISNLVDTLVPEAHGTTLQPANGSIDSESEVKHVTIADPPIKAEILASKRKREHFVSKEPASISNNLGKIAESRLSRLYKPKSNGKGKKKEEEDNDDASSTSSASSAARMLNPGSRETSRASSVASVRSTRMVVESSPSVLPRVNSIIKAARPPPPKVPPPPPPAPLPPTLMHAHSHHRALPTHPPPLSRQPTQPRSIQRTPSRSNVNEEPPTPSTSSMQMPAPPRRAPPAAGSPVTRSNCRYHKIELPDDEESDQRRCFLVPGCSLGNKELMDDENIKDMGNATAEDSERMVKDLDSMHFNSYLMSNLRQLVGVDLLREQEVYYLPPPGEEPPRKPRRREQSKLRISSAGSFASEGAMSPGVRSPASVSSRAPTSAAGSSSTASAQARRRKRSDRGSPTPASWALSQGESTDDESPSAKRIRGADGEIRAAEAEGIAAAASGSPLRTRRSRRMDKEAAEYKPEGPDVGEESSGEEENKGRKKKRRGLKRGRQSEAAPAQEGGEDRKTKKLKIHESIGEGGAS